MTDDLERRTSFNTAISAIMELINTLQKIENSHKIDSLLKKKIVETILLMLNPFIPHVTKELWQHINNNTNIEDQKWPQFNEAALAQDEIKIVIQVNGKLRADMIISSDMEEETIKNNAKSIEAVKKFISNDDSIKKIIYVKEKLLNFVVN